MMCDISNKGHAGDCELISGNNTREENLDKRDKNDPAK
jgi:hypothetical protein